MIYHSCVKANSIFSRILGKQGFSQEIQHLSTQIALFKRGMFGNG